MVFFNRASRNIYVDILAILFGISSWISINGLWVELPLLVERLPEKWALASYLSIIVQCANIGPIFIGTLRTLCKGKIPMVWIILVLLGMVSHKMSKTTIFGHKYSKNVSQDLIFSIFSYEKISTAFNVGPYYTMVLFSCDQKMLFIN